MYNILGQLENKRNTVYYIKVAPHNDFTLINATKNLECIKTFSTSISVKG